MLLCLLWAVVVLVGQLYPFQPLVRQELATLDFRFRQRGARPPAPEIVILAIDQRSMVADTFSAEELAANPQLALLRAYPFPRRVYAEAIQRLCDAGAKVVAFDLLFLSPKDDDPLLSKAIGKYHDRVVIGSNFSDDGRQLMEPSVVVPEAVPTDSLSGYVNYWTDADGGIRRARYTTLASWQAGVAASEGEELLHSFDALVTERFGKPLPAIPGIEGLIDFAGPVGTFPSHPFYELFYGKAWEQNFRNGEEFRGKIVLIGPAANFQHDQHPTPFGRMDGVEIHANAITTLLRGHAPHPSVTWLGMLIILALAVATATLLTTAGHPLIKLALLAATCMAYAVVAQVAFTYCGVVLWMAAPLWTVVGGGVAGIAMQLLQEQLEKRRVRQTLERYVSKPVADEVLKNAESYQSSLGGQRKTVTILFSDLRGFTTLSEQSNPTDLVGQLNEYLTAMVEIVMKHGGTLDKFIGDAIMAVYGAPLSAGTVEDAWRAVQTATEMRAKLAELQTSWAAQAKPVLQMGVGINHGEVLVGNIGSPQRMEYTVIGDVVNVASRVEGLNKEFGTDILITEAVFELVRDRVEVEPKEETSVKGRGQKIKVYFLKRAQ